MRARTIESLVAGAILSIVPGRLVHAAGISLSGTVTDLAGKPLRGVAILLAPEDTATGTDSLGSWKFDGGKSGLKANPTRIATDLFSQRIVFEQGRLKVRYEGFDASGRSRTSWTPPPMVAAPAAARSTATASTDTIFLAWNGRVRASLMPLSLTSGALGTTKIDTSTLAGDIRWGTGTFRYGRLTDPRDGQEYRTIAIGSQIWMAENLDFKVDSSVRATGSVDTAAKYGRHYQWAAAMGLSSSYNGTKWTGSDLRRQGVCPTGWHLPSDTDWGTLKRHIDPAEGGVGSKLSSVGGWRGVPVVAGAVDSFGFRGLPAGSVCCGGISKSSGEESWWWSATQGTEASQAGVFGKTGAAVAEKSRWHSVRCISDSAASDPYADIKILPRDLGGKSIQVPKGTKTKPMGGTPDSATYGYYVYLPSGALDTNTTSRFPLVISVHGSGFSEEAGLEAQLGLGIHYLIANGKWKPNYPFIVASPQNHTESGWNATELNNYISYLVAHYPVDPKRVYLVGMSLGAMGIYNYLMTLGSKSQVAAAVPIAGNAGTANAKNITCPVWAFHGGKDANVSPAGDKAFIAALQAAHPELDVKITMFTNLAHEWNIWYYPYYQNAVAEETEKDGRTDIDPAFAPYNRSIYDWMLLYKHP